MIAELGPLMPPAPPAAPAVAVAVAVAWSEPHRDGHGCPGAPLQISAGNPSWAGLQTLSRRHGVSCVPDIYRNALGDRSCTVVPGLPAVSA